MRRTEERERGRFARTVSVDYLSAFSRLPPPSVPPSFPLAHLTRWELAAAAVPQQLPRERERICRLYWERERRIAVTKATSRVRDRVSGPHLTLLIERQPASQCRRGRQPDGRTHGTCTHVFQERISPPREAASSSPRCTAASELSKSIVWQWRPTG